MENNPKIFKNARNSLDYNAATATPVVSRNQYFSEQKTFEKKSIKP
jgi:hypothetical protein